MIPSAAYGVDGVILIDQAHALAGSVTPGDGPGFPISITRPGSYRLQSSDSGRATIGRDDGVAVGKLVGQTQITAGLNGLRSPSQTLTITL